MNKAIDLIKTFIIELRKIRSDIVFEYEYLEYEGIYAVYHSYTGIHADKEYRRTLNRLYAKLFSENQIYCVSVLLKRDLAVKDYRGAYLSDELAYCVNNVTYPEINMIQEKNNTKDFDQCIEHTVNAQPQVRTEKSKHKKEFELAA